MENNGKISGKWTKNANWTTLMPDQQQLSENNNPTLLLASELGRITFVMFAFVDYLVDEKFFLSADGDWFLSSVWKSNPGTSQRPGLDWS